jgi:hypothetical protein
VTDIAGWTYQAAVHRSALAIAGGVVLGLVSGLGPCALARAAAIVALTEAAPRRGVVLALLAYAAGASVGYVAFGTIAGFAMGAAAWSSYSYAGLAGILLFAGIASLVRPPAHRHGTGATSIGGASLAGLGSSLTLSPCCTPFVLALTAVAFGDARFAAVLLCGFTAGHVVPAVAMAAIARAGRTLGNLRPDFVAFASGTISLALAGYYGLLV